MKILSFPAWLAVGVVLAMARLAAQDAIVTDPAWLDPEKPGADVAPAFRRKPKLERPEALRALDRVAYFLAIVAVDAKGRAAYQWGRITDDSLEQPVSSTLSFSPGVRGGKPVASVCLYGGIFNPVSSPDDKETGPARVLAVAPVAVEEMQLASEIPKTFVVVKLDAAGAVVDFSFENPKHEVLRAVTKAALARWRFAPARRAGQAVESTLRVPVLVFWRSIFAASYTQPKLLSHEDPVYPRTMMNAGLNGLVRLEFLVDENGVVRNPVVVESDNPGFNSAAIEALLQWKFKPAAIGGSPTSCRMGQTIQFDYTDDEGGGRDFTRIKPVSQKAKAGLPEELRYDVPPKAKSVTLPVYPYALLRAGTGGRVKAMFAVDVNGDVAEINVTESTAPEFALAVAAALDATKFIPAMKEGRPSVAVLRQEKEFAVGGYDSTVSREDEKLVALEAKHPEKILSPKNLDAPLKPLSQRAPVFPTALIGKLDRGEAKIEVLIDEKGVVRLPRIVQATSPEFGYAAMQAVVEWRFAPPTAGGKPAVARGRLPFVFASATPAPAPDAARPEPKTP